MSLRRLLALCLSVFPLAAQSYQDSFSGPTFDTSHAPKHGFGDLTVDPATGRVHMNIPLGPGIGARGAVYRPAIQMKETYVHTFQAFVHHALFDYPIAIPWQLTNDGIFSFTGACLNDVAGWAEVHSGESTQSLLPGYLVLGLPREGRITGQDRTSRFEVGDLNGVLNSTSLLPQALDVSAILQKFRYHASVQVGPGPGFQFQPGTYPSPMLQMASDQFLVMALTGGANNEYAPRSFQEGYYTNHATPSAILPYVVPAAILVVDRDVAYEFTFAYTKTDAGSTFESDGQGNTNVPIYFAGHGIYRLNRILNAFGDQIAFTYVTPQGTQVASQISARWIRNGVDTPVGIRMTQGAPITVAYEGLPQPISYSVGTAGGMWGSWISYDPDHVGFWDGPAQNGILADKPWVQIPLSSVTQDQTQERIDFKSVGGLPSVVYSKSGDSPNRTVSMHWSGEVPFLYCQKSEAIPYPGRAWTIGVTQIDDTVPGPNGAVTRTTSYDRVIPVPNTWLSPQVQAPGMIGWAPDPNGTVLANPMGWPAGAKHTSKVTMPDGRSVLYTYAPPTSPTASINYLAFAKSVLVQEDSFDAAGQLEKSIVHSNLDARTVGNPQGTRGIPVPYMTRTDAKNYLAGQWLVQDLNPSSSIANVGWDEVNLGWKGRQMLVKDLGGSQIVDRTVGKVLTSHLNVFLPAQASQDLPIDPLVRIPVSRTFDSSTDLVLTETHGDASASQVVLHSNWNSETGTLSDAWINTLGATAKVHGSKYGYDDLGYLSSITPIDAAFASLSVSQSSNGVGWPTSQTDPNGLTSNFTWDAVGHLATTALPATEAGVSYAYDPGALTLTVTRGPDQVQKYVYNGFGELIRTLRKDGIGWSHQARGYNVAGRQIWSTVWRPGDGALVDWTSSQGPDDPSATVFSKSTHFWYDASGRITKTQNPNQEVIQNGYTSLTSGSTKTITLAPGTSDQRVTNQTFDPLGRLISIVDAAGQETNYTYDNADRPLSVTQWSGLKGALPSQARGWTYDALGRLVVVDQPESGVTYYAQFTPLGKPQKTVYGLPRGWRPLSVNVEDSSASAQSQVRIVATAYDNLGRVASVGANDGSFNQSFVFGEAEPGHGYANGKIVRAIDGNVVRVMDYNGLNGRLSSLNYSISGQSFGLGSTYDPTYGFLKSRSYPDGTIQEFTYDKPKGLPNSVDFKGSNLASLGYDSTHWGLTGVIYGNGSVVSLDYGDDQTRLKKMMPTIPGKTLPTWNYTYDFVGNLRTDGVDIYSYDPLNRLSKAYVRDPQDSISSEGIQQVFDYDAFGNRKKLLTWRVQNWSGTEPPVPALAPLSDARGLRTYTMNGAELSDLAVTNHLPTSVGGAPTGALYDAQGNLTNIYRTDSSAQLSMSYDALGRVVSMGDTSRPGHFEHYSYDDQGLRVLVDEYQDGILMMRRFRIYNEVRQLVSEYDMVKE